MMQNKKLSDTPHSKKTVLIVDDIPYVRKTMKQILTSLGFKVVGEAESADEAVRLYKEVQPDLVTMDLVMPKKNGVVATREIIEYDPHANIVILSGMMQENLVTEAILAGAKDYIVKPFFSEDVAKVLTNVVGTSRGENRASTGAA
jgi:two-component system chemotaxis response regulator CheY